MSNLTANINLFELLKEYEHEQVVFCNDKATGLRSIIAIHDTSLGPSLGGTRMWNYTNEADALTDVLRLSRGMTFKSAISGINLGGGKAVIIGNSLTDKSEMMWRRYGKFVESLGGKYITAEDVGTSTQDIEYIHQETNHVAGKPKYLNGSGDPSPFTAYGVYLGMKASMKKSTGSDSLAGKKIAVQGVGHVGYYLMDHLLKEGAIVTICDINENNLKAVTDKHKVSVVAPDAIYDVDCDIYAPCALGATVNDATIERLKCSIIAGAANNQLASEKIHGDIVKAKGIVYAPDFLINAGGVINCYIEVCGEYNEERSMASINKIYDRSLEIFELSDKQGINNQEAAIMIAKQRIEAARTLKGRR
jgi:leucine dehydrogenase